MLSPFENLLFFILLTLSVGAAIVGFNQVYQIVRRGGGELHLEGLPRRLWIAFRNYFFQTSTLKTRRITSLFHLGIVLGFTFYFIVNVVDVLIGVVDGFEESLAALDGAALAVYDGYRLLADILTVAVLVGMVYFIARRLVLPNRRELAYHDNILLHPKVREGRILTDSLIVGIFILIHVGARFTGEALLLASEGHADLFQPFATVASGLFVSWDATTLEIGRHLAWWAAIGAILLFLPYFPYTKHLHLMLAPLNYLTRPRRTSMGELPPLDFADENVEQFGAHLVEHLSQTQIMDAFACIMCNRCQDVCPAYVTGKELSPSALEINKRYYIKDHMDGLAAGAESDWPLLGSVMSESAMWACTACAACVEICPVGNEPMFDIMDMRRDAILTQGEVPGELQEAFNGMERQGNPWNLAGSRVAWAEGLDIPTVEDNPDFELLYWTGCAVSYDDNAQRTARSFVRIMQAAGVNFAILGEAESCTGDVARRAGNEYLYHEMASANVATLNAVAPKRIVATCPHCLHNLGKEYHQFGGDYEVVHHTELIAELIAAGRLPATAHPAGWSNVTFHDPCYLGRQNGVIEAPRTALHATGGQLIEMPRHGANSFCCGAGGAQFWKEEEHGDARVNITRYEEARATGAEVMAVGCPFCMTMFTDASKEITGGPVVRDVAELIAEALPEPAPAGD
jgi:Fe-S oxidoreductase/nitrate reductase gamma subunit